MLKTNIIPLVLVVIFLIGCENQGPPMKQMDSLLDEAPSISLISINLIVNKNYSSDRSRTIKKEDVNKFINLIENLKLKRVSQGAEFKAFFDKFNKKRQNSESLQFYLLHNDTFDGPNNGFMIEILQDGSGLFVDVEKNKGERMYKITNATEEIYSQLFEFYQTQDKKQPDTTKSVFEDEPKEKNEENPRFKQGP
ncbi:hypothetical protein [Pontibacillus marinus]|uniref:Lipoprotein n=1 Tax=Pontibacillus marinus BH030004 = DSM 16465 TaxID=1385511 RepID=A0A0A5GEF8_9BACI|nr:hypothetical protein [Pontibacillus marinus]KGX89490.1 hypothetical protein N783_06190 [Pontibacillus marinus BH030004 = DSM 16465]